MTFRRGIFFGIVLIIGSIVEMMNGSGSLFGGMNKTFGIVILSFSSILGVIQIAASINYLNTIKVKLLLACFILEGIYYFIATIFLIGTKISMGMKMFGGFISLVLLIIIGTAISNLISKITSFE